MVVELLVKVIYNTVDEVENNIFTNSLIGATIQDGSKRERSDAFPVH